MNNMDENELFGISEQLESSHFAAPGNMVGDLISRREAEDIVRFECGEWTGLAETIVKRFEALPSAQPGQRNARVFQGIIVEYPSISAYPEYDGKPYFSIKYTENGQEFIGYGTYKPEVLSEYLKEYFMPPTQPGWIPCSERRPPDEINPHTMDYKLYVCSCDFGDSKDVRAYKYGDGHFWNGPGMVDEYVVAWCPLPEPWKGEE